MKISLSTARRLAIQAQLLDSNNKLPDGKPGIARVIDRLGYIQIDTIAAIRRAHHHTLWTRRNDYHEGMLDELQAQDRLVFEYWAHAMAYLPMVDFRFFLPRMHNFRNPKSKWAKPLLEKHRHLLQPVLERVRAEGPLSSKDFESEPGKKGGTWWDWKPTKMVLELLFWRGELMVSARRNFQKIYDLTERVLPANIDTHMPASEEIGRFLIRRALAALGLASDRELVKFMQPGSSRDADMQVADKIVLARAIQQLVEEKVVIPLHLEGNANAVYYAFSEAVERMSSSAPELEQVHLLSPFDNLIIQRDRVKRLFNFDYSLECYVPAAKRKFGYFALPILRNDALIGQLDPKADRKTRTLIIHKLAFESSFTEFDAVLLPLARKLVDFARFNGCEKILFENVMPESMHVPLLTFVKTAMTY